MSTLTRTNSHSKKPQYNEYVKFLESYKNGKKDDNGSEDSGVNFSLTNSSNNSSSSVFSDVSDGAHQKNGFKNYLDNSNHKKFSSPTPKTTVKTEVFIEIKNPPVQNFSTQVFEVHNVDNPEEATLSVSSATKMFEKESHQFQTNGHHSRSNTLKHSFSKKNNTIGQISKKFEASTPSMSVEDITRIPTKKANSIGEVSKIFENGKPESSRPKNFNSIPKPFHASAIVAKQNNGSALVKPAITSPKPVVVAPQFPKPHSETIKSSMDNIDSPFSSLHSTISSTQSTTLPPHGRFSSVSSVPLPPPPPPPFSSPSSLQTHPSLPVIHSSPSASVASSPPPPPPLPPSNFATKPVINGLPKHSHQIKPIRTQNSKVVVEASSNGVSQNGIDKSDPRVKKAVYGALRSMYGAYHDQANDYLATLPKNRVRKNNGLDNIIETIASQGGLAKLNGRVNPNPEVME